MGWYWIGAAFAIPLLIAVIGDLLAHKNGRPNRIDPQALKRGRKRVRGHGFGVTATRQERLYRMNEPVREKPVKRQND